VPDERMLLAARLVAGTASPRDWAEAMGPTGLLAYTLRGPGGELKQAGVCANLITDAGDLYTANRIIAGVAPAAPADVTKAIGMKLGTGTTPAAKNAGGAVLGTYTAGSHRAFDAGKPDIVNLGAGLGVQARYVSTYPAGVVTQSGLAEAIIAIEATLTDATNTAGTTACRGLLSPVVNKGAADTLTLTWTWKYLGA
jgi:hypothetical protein